MNIKSFGISTLAALLVVGCGGGGGGGGGFTGGGPETATAVITEGNAEDIIRAVASSSEFAQDLLLGLVLGADSFSASGAQTASDDINAPATSAFVQAAIAGYNTTENDGQYLVLPAAAAYCSSGSATVNGTGTDTVTYNFYDCSDFSYTDIYDNTVEFPGTTDGVLAIEIFSAVSLQDFVVRIIWGDFSSDDDGEFLMADGNMTLDYFETANAIQFDFSTDRFDYSENEESGSLTNYSYELDFNLAKFVEDGVGGVESSVFDGLAFFNINPDFVTLDDDFHSSSGQIIIYGINDTKIRLTALDADDAQIELDLTGGDPDGGDDDYEISYEISWNELLQII
jgi:hypothetical protein